MKIDGKPYRTIWLNDDGWGVDIIDQTRLPHEFIVARLETLEDTIYAIGDMQVRGAPLIGVTAAYGIALALRTDAGDQALAAACDKLVAARPTAVNLAWAVKFVRAQLLRLPEGDRASAAYQLAAEMADEDAEICRSIGRYGVKILESIASKKTGPVNILTHCNAGALATVEWGTATAPIYMAQAKGMKLHVWVDETRPRNQGAALTAYELGQAGVEHTVIVDNVGGHLMQNDMVDLCIVGTDRTTASGDVCNKIGTYLKALAAHDNGVPFYVALPGPTIDWNLENGADIPIEQRPGDEVKYLAGRTRDGKMEAVDILAPGSSVANYAFDVTPAKYITGLITERGVCAASKKGLLGLYPEQAG
jgi:methylthioribose-1-phosphate isomerase